MAWVRVLVVAAHFPPGEVLQQRDDPRRAPGERRDVYVHYGCVDAEQQSTQQYHHGGVVFSGQEGGDGDVEEGSEGENGEVQADECVGVFE